MRRRTWFITLGICASLALHALVFWAILWRQARVYEADLLLQAGRAPAAEPLKADLETLANPYGELGGKGESINSTPGEFPQQSPNKSEHEQAALSRDPVGLSAAMEMSALGEAWRDGKRADTVLPDGEDQGSPLGPPIASSPPVPAIHQRLPRTHGPAAAPPPPETAIGRATAAEVPAPAPQPIAAATPSPLAQALPRATGGTTPTFPSAAAKSVAGDPYPMADQESDPFQKNAFAVFKNGKMEARPGRKARLTRPLLSFKAIADIAGMYPGPSVMLGIKTDATGKVVDVTWPPLRSSGSNEIDMPVYEAAWHWWFEPPRDKEGKPQPAEFKYGITFVQ